MPALLMSLVAAAVYLLATVALIKDLHRGLPVGRSRAALWLALPALALHAGTHGWIWADLNGLDMHFYAALSLVGLGMAALSTLAARSQRLDALGVVVYPLAAFFLLLYGFAERHPPTDLDWRLQSHAWLALLAYAALAVAALIALMLWFQERALRQRQIRGWLRILPPLTQLEALLFRSLTAAFVVLTLALVTGALFVENLLAQHLWHKTSLSFLSWLVLGALLLGRWRFGWRGRRAVVLTLTAMSLLLLAFFGSKFVLEMPLGQV